MAKPDQLQLQQVKTQIEQGQLAKALAMLQQLELDTAAQQVVSQLLARYAKVKKELHAGTLAYEDGTRTLNQITLALLDFVASLAAGEPINPATTNATHSGVQQQAKKIYNIQHIDKADFS
jgi:hypothetical protein